MDILGTDLDQFQFLLSDGGHNVNEQVQLSGEPLIPPFNEFFKLRDSMPVNEYHNLIVEASKFEESYLDYWNSSGDDNGQMVDAVIMPTAPHAAVIPGRFYHTGSLLFNHH